MAADNLAVGKKRRSSEESRQCTCCLSLGLAVVEDVDVALRVEGREGVQGGGSGGGEFLDTQQVTEHICIP